MDYELFIKCYLSKNFSNLGEHLPHVKMKKVKAEYHINHSLQFCFNLQGQKDWESNKVQNFKSRLKKKQ